MLVLALDTTTRAGSAALLRDGRLLDHMAGDPALMHAERLPGDLVQLLGRQRLGLAAVDVFAVAAGPGAFTGLRVGMATIQGLAFALQRPVVPLSALDLLAQVGAAWDGVAPADPPPPGTLVGAVMDAQREEVFAALFRLVSPVGREARPDGLPDSRAFDDIGGAPPVEFEKIDPPVAEPPDALLARWAALVAADARAGAAGGPLVLAGDGALRYRHVVDAVFGTLGRVVRVIDPVPPLAPALARLAAVRAERGGGVAPHAVRPIYLRRADAELARDRRRAAGPGETG